jgi:polyketide synthase PksN
LSEYQAWPHGFVALPTLLASAPALRSLCEAPKLLRELSAQCDANEGHLAVAVRTLRALDWVARDARGMLHARAYAAEAAQLSCLRELVPAVYADPAEGSACCIAALEPWAEAAAGEWPDLPDDSALPPLLRQLLTGAVLTPVLLHLRAQFKERALHGPDELDGVAPGVVALLHAKGMAVPSGSRFELTSVGRSVIERSVSFRVIFSYRPMLRQLSTVLFGDVGTVFGVDADGHKTHVDRTMNVLASGLMHQRYFSDMAHVHLAATFDALPLADQPRFIVMGCGDGRLLRKLYKCVRDHTMRGRRLREWPLTIIGVDSNAKSLESTARCLTDSGVPHVLQRGDIGNPHALMTEIEQRFGPNGAYAYLHVHVRSLLGHDRLYIAPVEPSDAAVDAAIDSASDAAYVDSSGGSIPPSVAFRSAVEHLRRWASVLGVHGLLMLEVHLLDVRATYQHMWTATSLHFDALQAWSSQMLLPAAQGAAAVAAAGLSSSERLCYPNDSGFTRIVLQRLVPSQVSIRLARPSDVASLVGLERFQPVGLRADQQTLLRRQRQHATGQFLAERLRDGAAIGSVYTQRLATELDMLGSSRTSELELHTPDGPVVQLLGLVVHPDAVGVGETLRAFAVSLAALDPSVSYVCGVTRCREYAPGGGVSMEAHARLGRDRGLQFHLGGGAEVLRVLPGYRPGDEVNDGYGVLVRYSLRGASGEKRGEGVGRGDGAALRAAGAAPHGLSTLSDFDALVRSVLHGLRHQESWPSALSSNDGFMELGLDSLDVVQLADRLGMALGCSLGAATVFAHPTPSALARYLWTIHGCEDAARVAAQPAALPKAPAHGGGAPRMALHGSCTGRWPACAYGLSPRLLFACADAIALVAGERWSADDVAGHPPHLQQCIGHAGLLSRVEYFDNTIFRISVAEAQLMDPQQRLLLETGHQALFQARPSLAGLDIAVYVAVSHCDFQARLAGSDSVFAATGAAMSIASGRLSYVLGLQGACMSVDTACSSSLAAVHIACSSTPTPALVASANVMLAPAVPLAYARAGMLSASGRCRTFDAHANGYVRSEGCAAVALAPGSCARASLCATAVRQDGRSASLTAPNGSAQRLLLKRTSSAAGLRAGDLAMLEAHGTGTALGDPTEVTAGCDAVDASFLWGSVKASLGHLEPTAGMAGLAKLAVACEQRSAFGNAQLRTLNAHIRDLMRSAAPASFSAQRLGIHRPATAVGGLSSFGKHREAAQPPRTPEGGIPSGGVQGVGVTRAFSGAGGCT